MLRVFHQLPALGLIIGLIIVAAPLLRGQPSALSISKTHVGSFTQGQNAATYKVTVSNGASAGATIGPVTMSDTLPTGLTATAIAGSGWTCTLGTLSCTRNDALAAGASYPAITVTVNVAAAAASPQTNSVTLTGGGSPPATANDSTTILAPFTDTSPSDFFFDAVNLMREYSVTAGCSVSPPMYCPNDNVTRAQMAIFLVRAVLGSDTFSYSSTPHFNDVPSTAFGFQWIQKMFELGITAGCGNGNYCPNDPVTRGQMAVFVIRARLGASADSTFTYAATPSFTDVPADNIFFKWIQRMKRDSITGGCGNGTTYCPNDPVTRGQMAIFIVRGAFNLLLPAGTPVISSVTPSSAAPGQTVNVAIAGSNTNFVTGTTTVSGGSGITANNVLATNGSTLTAQFVIDPAAAAGPRSILAATGSEEAVLPNGFTIATVAAVTIHNFAFSPDPENASAGGFVSWTNTDGVNHHIVSDTSGIFDTQVIAPNATATVSAPTTGSYPYHCTIHPFMKGTLTVH